MIAQSGSMAPRFGVVMTALRRQTRAPWIVLAAVAGMLPVVRYAPASWSAEASRCTMTCCIVDPPPACPACLMGSTAADEADGRPSVILATAVGLQVPARPCECVRDGTPAAPSPEPGSTDPSQRSGEFHGETVALAVSDRPAAAFVCLIPPTGSPPRSPLYLRNARLLI
jgi:hypothetical protein